MKNNLDLDTLCINAIRTLAIDGVEQAKAGHPGMPMGTAPLAYQLWTKHLRHNPKNPNWANRDRFVLSAGHGSMLLYSLLHLTGYDLPLDELKRFRQLYSKTPGHPEYGHTPGVETTTGPLGQGFGNGVGMAIAQKYLGTYFNRDGFDLLDYKIYAIVSDGDIMEGVQSEAASLAGHLKLDNIIYFYDDNSISIDGETDLSFSEDVAKRYEAYGWNIERAEGNDLQSVEAALRNAQTDNGDKPTLIVTKTIIGYGSPNKQNTAASHGAALGEDEVRKTKEVYGYDPDKTFFIPEEALSHFRLAVNAGESLESDWKNLLASYQKKYPELYQDFVKFQEGLLDIDWKKLLPKFSPENGKLATRAASGKTLEEIASHNPFIIGGSADLTPSNNTNVSYYEDFSASNRLGRYIRYGVREHGMGSIMSGMALSGLRPYGGTFLIFSDYMRATIRLAAMMKQPVIYVFTHDSIGLGEDGPTHQPTEHISSLRAIPNLQVIRPADANETALAWQMALEHKVGPTVLALTRQGLPILDREHYSGAEGIFKGGYVLAGNDHEDLLLIATGSEVQLAIGAYEELLKQGIKARVVNMACWDVFDRQPESYRNSVLPPQISKRIAVEAAVTHGWHKYTGLNGVHIALDRFGESAKGEEAMEALGFTVDNVVGKALELLETAC